MDDPFDIFDNYINWAWQLPMFFNYIANMSVILGATQQSQKWFIVRDEHCY